MSVGNSCCSPRRSAGPPPSLRENFPPTRVWRFHFHLELSASNTRPRRTRPASHSAGSTLLSSAGPVRTNCPPPHQHRIFPVATTTPTRFLPSSARAAYDRPPSSRPIGLAPRRLGTHSPLFYVKSIFPSIFPAPSPPPSGFSIGECLDDLIGSYRGPTPRVDGRALLDDSRPIVFEDVDRKASRTNSTRHTRDYGGNARDGFLLGCFISIFHHIRFP